LFEEVCALAELDEGRPRIVKLKGRDIVLVRWHGEVHAVRNICPHQTQSFARANIRPSFAAARVGELVVDTAEPVLVCPVHGWSFRLRSGQCTVDESLRIRSYAIAIEDGRVLVDVSA
jgi:nitrite reductase (NADH) small subunit